jgi:DNA mismatch repair protein MutL
MKFLKKDVGEGNAVALTVEKCALSHPEVAFRFIRDGQQKLRTSGSGELLPVIQVIYGGELAAGMLPVDYRLDGALRVTGYISKPSAARASRTSQNFFINGRYVRSRTCSAALEEACKGKLPSGRYPACALNVEMLAQTVDVNVHPAKIEVRFSDERPVFNAVFFAVKSAISATGTPLSPVADEAKKRGGINELTLHLPQNEYRQQRLTVAEFKEQLARDSRKPADSAFGEAVSLNSPDRAEEARPIPRRRTDIDIAVEGDRRVPVEKWREPPVSDIIPAPDASNILSDAAIIAAEKHTLTMRDSASPVAVTEKPIDATPQDEVEEPPADEAEIIPARVIGELFGTYILIERGESLLLVDKHAAHERLKYEELLGNLAYGNRQVLLEPISVTLPREEYGAALENPGAIEDLGFGVEDFGDGVILIREAPIELGELDIPGIVGEVAARLARGNKDLTPDALDRLYYSIACNSALRAGDRNSPEELAELARRLERNPHITHCPHGRPVTVELSRARIEKLFGRIV